MKPLKFVVKHLMTICAIVLFLSAASPAQAFSRLGRVYANNPYVTESNSGTVNLNFTVSGYPPSSFDGTFDRSVTVDYTTNDVTATAGTDYTSTSGSVTFMTGTHATVSVPIKGDTTTEGNETFTLKLTPSTFGFIGSSATGTIVDDDAPLISIGNVNLVEGNGTTNATFNVTLSGTSPASITVNYATADGTATQPADYTSASGTLTFAPGETAQSITVPIVGDASDEATETFFVNLSAPVNAFINKSQGIGTITDDDVAPTLSINNVSISEGNSGQKNLSFAVTPSIVSGKVITVKYATADGTAKQPADYTAASGTLTIPANQASGLITIPIQGDALDESNETFFVNLGQATNATLSASAQGIGTILDDDNAPLISINDVSVVEGNPPSNGAPGTADATFTLTLSAISGQSVTVSAIPANGTARAPFDYTSGGKTLTFAPGENSKTFSVPVVGDTLNEDAENFYVLLSSPVNSVITRGRGVGTINDDDSAPSITIEDLSMGEGNSGQRTAVLRLHLSSPSGKLVKVSYNTDTSGTAKSSDDYDAVPTTQIAFATGQTVALARVLINGDTLDEADETFKVNLSGAVNASIVDNQAIGTILNDDRAPALLITDVNATEGNSGARNIVFIVSLSAISGQTITVNYATANGTAQSGSDYVAKSGTLTFGPGQINNTFSVSINGDTQVEQDELFYVLLSGATNATIAKARGTGTILNDDASG